MKPLLNCWNSIIFNKGIIVGDPRIDRVGAIAEKAKAFPIIHRFKGDKKLFIWGSTHAKDESILFEFLSTIKPKIFQDWKFLIVPHEIKETHLSIFEKNCPIPTKRYSLMCSCR